jgi:2',3'-cyclic-nucleotide 2'-phosphodiesterase (5'-nucleotidase family)
MPQPEPSAAAVIVLEKLEALQATVNQGFPPLAVGLESSDAVSAIRPSAIRLSNVGHLRKTAGLLVLLVACSRGASVAPVPSPTLASPHLATGRWLRILATNDFHGALEPRRDSRGVLRGGAAALAAEIRRARDECRAPRCTALLLDGGDEFQGTPASNMGYGRPVVAVFNRLGRAASALGNHEFDWGQDTLRARMREAAYPILGANVTDAGGKDIAWIPDDTIVTTGGLRVGIIGIATVVTPTTTKPSNVSDLRFVDPVPVVNRSAKALRARGAQFVVVVAHAGAFCEPSPATPSCDGEIVDLARGLTERVNAIVSGHTHSPVTTVVNGVPIIQARSRGTALGVMDVSLSGATPVIALRDVLPDRIVPDPAIDSLVRAVTEPLNAIVNRPISTAADPMSGALLGTYMADAFRLAGGGDVSVMNPGGVRAGLDTGVVTYGELFEIAPFANMLVRLTITGSGLRAWLEKAVAAGALLSGVVVTADTTRPRGSRIISVTMSDRQPLEDARTYRLVYSDFLHANGDGLQATEGVLKVDELGIIDIDALTESVRSNSPVRAPRDERVIIRTP